MNFITLDIETYYDKQYSLSKMTTEEYIRGDQFEIIGLAVKLNDEETAWASGTHEELKEFLETYPWSDSMLVAHNTMFDGFILTQILGIKPKAYADTLCMARALHGVEVGGSLAALTERYGIGKKGTEVLNALGKHRLDFNEEALSRYGDYCVNDVELTYKLFNLMVKRGFPKKEMKLIDLTLRMFVEPKLDLDLTLLEQHLMEVRQRKEKLLVDAGVSKEDLASNPKFAELLRSYGVEPPMKTSPATGKDTFALAKNDEEFKALANHEDERIQALVSARLGTKSTLEETRTERFIGIANRGLMPVPLKYYAAHTGRWGGSDNLNLQNLPSRGANGGKLKKAIIAPEGYVIIDSDSSQIEARVLAWLAGQDDLVTAFKNGEDVYKIMASAIYNKPVEEITKDERFVGKTTILGCFGEDTKVLTDSGWKRIVEVQATDMLWDGKEWVTHQGVIPQGEKEVITAWGLDATADHEILTEHGWREWKEVITNRSLFQSALNKVNLPLQDGLGITEGTILPYDARVGGKDELIGITLTPKKLLDAIRVLRSLVTKLVRSIWGMQISYQIGNIVNGCLTAYQVAYHAVIQKLVKPILNMGVEVLPYTSLGVPIVQTSYATLFHSLDGMTQNETLIESTTTKGMNPIIYDLRLAQKMLETNDEYPICKKKLMTYDIAYAGPRNRYTVATSVGPIIVHNCGYGMGAVKFRAQLKTFGVEISEDESRHIINVYRATYPQITALWKQAHTAIFALAQENFTELGREGVLKLVPKERAIQLPSGLLLRYDTLHSYEAESGYVEFRYKTRTGWNKIYGGKVIENVCQAIARCVIGEQMIKIAKKYDVVLTVHDAIACLAREDEVADAQKYVEECMRWVPDWATGLPVNCESGYGKSYGDC